MKQKEGRSYSQLVADETIEDYALRYAPKSFRKWPEWLIANTALGSISFLALEAIGASIGLHYGFTTAFWAILFASVIIFVTAIPISYYAARYNIDIDLITRSAGFGYVGSTFTSLIYASFSFIFFALEGAIMAQALQLYFGLPLGWGYLLSAVVVIPIVFYGITAINRFQLWTQPIWIGMMLAPFVAIWWKDPTLISHWLTRLDGSETGSHAFDVMAFGVALGVSLSLIPQIGEQVDYLRFMPEKTRENRWRWWFSVLAAGPGWIVIGFVKQIAGLLLVALALMAGLSVAEAKQPVEMYYIGYRYVIDNPEIALALATFFVVVSQIKINVTNAYAGSLAWSNFFSRITYAHPGRVVWLIFNITIALLLMELGVFDTLDKVLGLYSNVAIAWIGAIFADLVINKPLGLAPKMVEFKRGNLFNVNPVGVGSMGVASLVAIIAFMGYLGPWAQAYSSLIALGLAVILSPLIAWLTKGRYYLVRPQDQVLSDLGVETCQVCNIVYEVEDMVHCPMHEGDICSLCCTLESLCHDQCKQSAERGVRIKLAEWLSERLKGRLTKAGSLRLLDFVILIFGISILLWVSGWMVFDIQKQGLSVEAQSALWAGLKSFMWLVWILLSILIWWILLMLDSKQRAEEALEEQNEVLQQTAITDPLTQLYNRRYFSDFSRKLLALAEREQSPISVVMLDIDHFKLVNDTYGHQVGDEVIVKLAELIRQNQRESDVSCRYGGEEFVLLLPETKASEAYEVAERLRKQVEAVSMDLPLGEKLHFTISLGVACTVPSRGEDIEFVLKLADEALYQAKTSGRNQVCMAESYLIAKS